MELEKIFFNAGDAVKCKHIDGPLMVVKRINKSHNTKENLSLFLGVTCYWFTDNNFYQENMFSTKDLEKI